MTKLKKVVEENEASLFQSKGKGFLSFLFSKYQGEIEYKRYADNSAKLEIKLISLDVLTDQSLISVIIDDDQKLQLKVNRGKNYINLYTDNGDIVPLIRAGDKVLIMFDGRVLCEGVFRRD